MQIGNYILEAPHLLKIIKNELIGNGGKPDRNGDAVGGYVRAAEIQYSAAKGAYWYRPMRTDDSFTGYTTARTWSQTYTTVDAEELLAQGASQTVPTAESMVHFGWYCPLDLGRAGYLQVMKHGVVKEEIPARIVWRQQNPDHMYIDIDKVVHCVQNEVYRVAIYNGTPSDMVGQIMPIMFRIAPRAALNLEKAVR